MLSKIVRTEFESKSQRMRIVVFASIRCYQRSSEQNLKANHNGGQSQMFVAVDVIKDRQNRIWKQITTGWLSADWSALMLSKIVRTEFESKSQLVPLAVVAGGWCYQRASEQNLNWGHSDEGTTSVAHDPVLPDQKQILGFYCLNFCKFRMATH